MLVPVVTTTLGASPEIWSRIKSGLASGLYERDGGVIRNAQNKEIITWLRSVSDDFDPTKSPFGTLGGLPQLTGVFSVLNLSITAIGFTLVMKRLNAVERHLSSISKALEGIGRKLDLGFCANFRAALELGRTAFAMTGEGNRQVAATQAINRFLESEHHYLGLIDFEFDEGAWAVSPLISSYFLASVIAARCYLELDELETARRHLYESTNAIASRVRRFHDAVIGVNPAIFLHPALTAEIPLERLANLVRLNSPGVTAPQVFETLRKQLWETASQPAEPWLKKLPAVLWNHERDGKAKFGPVRMSRSNDDMLGHLVPRLAETFTQVEHSHEGTGCMRGFETELAFLTANSINYGDWERQVAPTACDSIYLIVPNGS
jgi:hypothetical protein